MKGLFLKDIALMKMNKRFLLVEVVLAIVISLSMDDSSFIYGYLTFVTPLFALSTISYDEFENGNAFLFTLPISRRDYVLEKYFFALILGLVSLIIATVLVICMDMLAGLASLADTLPAVPPVFAIMTVFLAIMFPLQLKFGGEKGRIAMIAVMGTAFAIGYAFVKIADSKGIDVEALAGKLNEVNIGILVAVAVIIVLAALFISILISIRIMEKKE